MKKMIKVLNTNKRKLIKWRKFLMYVEFRKQFDPSPFTFYNLQTFEKINLNHATNFSVEIIFP